MVLRRLCQKLGDKNTSAARGASTVKHGNQIECCFLPEIQGCMVFVLSVWDSRGQSTFVARDGQVR